jgi:7-cyano-7-deazaguanine synthase
MIILSLVASAAIAERCTWVVYGAHSGDHAIYPDCRPEFAMKMAGALSFCHDEHLHLFAPWLYMTKGEIVDHCERRKLGVPWSATWTCYKGEDLHCGKCGACVERREAFATYGYTDPTDYQE